MSADSASYYCGANCYYLMSRMAGAPGSAERRLALDTLDAIQRMGFTVIRTWAFYDGKEEWPTLQPTPGQFNEDMFKGLDLLIDECAQRKLRLMLTLTNYWKNYGGMPQYIKWSKDRQVDTGDEFFLDPNCQRMYRNFIKAVITRTNTITGVAYKDDPTIFAWDIVNEARCKGDTSGKILTTWLRETSDYVKSLDSRHLVTAGLEGFFGPSTPEFHYANPYNAESEGCDFSANFKECWVQGPCMRMQVPSLDFACIHMYGDQWLPNRDDDEAVIEWSVKWIKAHMDAAKAINKPLCLQEFGKEPAGSARNRLFAKVYGLAVESMQNGGPLRGNAVWMVAKEEYPDYDGYTVYESGAPASHRDNKQPVVEDRDSVAVLKAAAAQFRKPPAS